MPTPIQQPNLNGGEISPTLYGRVDIERYHQALALCENFIVDPHGGVYNRQGTEFFAACKLQDGTTVRLITFQPSAETSFLLEFGHYYLRIFDEVGQLSIPANALLKSHDHTPITSQQVLSQLSLAAIWKVSESFIGDAVNPFSIGKIGFKLRRMPGDTMFPATVSIWTNAAGKPGAIVTGLGPTDFTSSSDWTDLGNVIPVYPSEPVWVTFELKDPTIGAAPFAAGTILHVVIQCQVAPVPSLSALAVAGTVNPPDPAYAGGTANTFTSAGGWVNQPAANDFLFQVFNNEPATLLEIVTPWAATIQDDIGTESQVSRLVVTQSVDVMTIVDGLKQEVAHELRNNDGAWSLVKLQKFVNVVPPLSVTFAPDAVQPMTAPTRPWRYAVSGVTQEGVEGLPVFSVEREVGANISIISPIRLIVTVGTDIPDHYVVYKGLSANADEGTYGFIGTIKMDKTLAELAQAAYEEAYRLKWNELRPNYSTPLSQIAQILLDTAAKAAGNAARAAAMAAGGVVPNTTQFVFHDENMAPDYTDQPRDGANPFTEDGGYRPACVCYFQQRLVFANVSFSGNNREPDTIYMSEVSDYRSWQRSVPTVDDDSIKVTLAQGQLNEIRFLVPKRDLLVLTTGAEHVLSGGGKPVSPSNLDAAPVSYRGCGTLHPLNVGNVVLFKDIGGHIREWLYEQTSNDYPAADLGQLASHLFRDVTTGEQVKVTEWAHVSSPTSMVTAIRADGMMLGFTYVRDQSVAAWTRHTTQGKFRSVAVARYIAQEGETLYVVAQRFILGVNHWYIERIKPRNEVTSPYSDSAVVITLPSQATLGEAVGEPNWTFLMGGIWTLDTLSQLVEGAVTEIKIPVFILPGSLLVPPEYPDFADTEKRWIILYDEYGKRFTMQILQVWPTVGLEMVYQVVLNNDIPLALANALRADGDDDPDAPKPHWALGAKQFPGFHHLDGEEVAVRADSGSHPNVIVPDDGFGIITLNVIANLVAAGLPFQSTIRTLSLATGNQDIKTKQKLISSVGLDVLNVKGLWVGETLTAMTQQRAELVDPTLGITGRIEIRCANRWGRNGQVYAQNRDPVPCTILSLSPEVTIGG